MSSAREILHLITSKNQKEICNKWSEKFNWIVERKVQLEIIKMTQKPLLEN